MTLEMRCFRVNSESNRTPRSYTTFTSDESRRTHVVLQVSGSGWRSCAVDWYASPTGQSLFNWSWHEPHHDVTCSKHRADRWHRTDTSWDQQSRRSFECHRRTADTRVDCDRQWSGRFHRYRPISKGKAAVCLITSVVERRTAIAKVTGNSSWEPSL